MIFNNQITIYKRIIQQFDFQIHIFDSIYSFVFVTKLRNIIQNSTFALRQLFSRYLSAKTRYCCLEFCTSRYSRFRDHKSII